MDSSGDLAAWPPEEEGSDETSPDARGEEPEDASSGGVGRVVFLLLSIVAVVAWNAWQLRVEVPEPSERDREGSARSAVFVAAQAVDAHVRREGEPPEDLAEVGLDGAGLRYERSGATYTVRAEGEPDVRAGSVRDAAGLLEGLAADSVDGPIPDPGG